MTCIGKEEGLGEEGDEAKTSIDELQIDTIFDIICINISLQTVVCWEQRGTV